MFGGFAPVQHFAAIAMRNHCAILDHMLGHLPGPPMVHLVHSMDQRPRSTYGPNCTFYYGRSKIALLMTKPTQGLALLRAFCARHPDLTQTDLAAAVGCSQQLVSALLSRGRAPAQLRVAVALERVCGIPPRAWLEVQS